MTHIEKIVKFENIDSFDLSGITCLDGRLFNTSNNKELEKINILKLNLIESLKESDIFTLDYSNDYDYDSESYEKECILYTYKVKVESDIDFEKRKNADEKRSKSYESKRLILIKNNSLRIIEEKEKELKRLKIEFKNNYI